MKRIVSVLLVAACVVCFAGCGAVKDVNKKDDAKLSVVVTSFVHCDIVRQIAGDKADVKMLIPPASEAHTYEPTPNDMLMLSSCDVFVYTGAESDVWVDKVLSGIDNDKMSMVSFSDIYHNNFAEQDKGHDEHQHSLDEHFWTNPEFSLKAARDIANLLCSKDRDNAVEYNLNFEEFSNEIEKICEGFDEIKNTRVRDKVVVADRFPFYHLSQFLGEEIEFYSPYPGCSGVTEPSAEAVAELSMLVKDEGIPCVFTIEFSNGKIAKSVANDVPVLTLYSCHTVSAEDFENGITYVELMNKNVENLKKALCE